MQRAFESPSTQLTVNQAAGIAVNAAAAAAVQPAKAYSGWHLHLRKMAAHLAHNLQRLAGADPPYATVVPWELGLSEQPH
jgi:hypothetical protein